LAARFEESQIRRSDYLVTHTDNHADLILKMLSIQDRSFQIIPHAININKNPCLPNKKASNNIRVLYAGRLEHRKGFDVLVKALPIVFKNTSRVIVDIIGDGNLITSAKKALLPQFSNGVVFHGYQPRALLENYYSECDLFVAPSRYESFGLIYLEAMSFSKPIIACNSGGTPEVVTHNETGILVEAGNHQELASAIICLTKDKILRKKMGNAGNLRVKSLFSIEKMIESTITQYTQNLNKI
jgi:glycosyltransferase involved in cell wall biosynthesis